MHPTPCKPRTRARCEPRPQTRSPAPYHQQPEVNYLPSFSPLFICLERSPLRGDRSREIDLFENLDIVHIRLLVVARHPQARQPCATRCLTTIPKRTAAFAQSEMDADALLCDQATLESRVLTAHLPRCRVVCQRAFYVCIAAGF